MKLSQRFTWSPCGILFVLCFAASSFGQAPRDDGAGAMLAVSSPGYARVKPSAAIQGQASQLQPANSTMILDFPANAVTSRDALTAGNSLGAASNGSNNGAANGNAALAAGGWNGDERFNHVRTTPPGGNIDGLDTVASFAGAFAAQAGPNKGGVFRFTMMGQHPLAGDTTIIPARITEVSLNLLNVPTGFDASVPYAPYDDLTLDSPNFEESNYASGRRIQFADAVQRAEFFNVMDGTWHTKLRPQVVNRVTIDIPLQVQVRLPNGNIVTVQSYFVGVAPDGSEFVEVLDLLFNNLFFNQAVNDINSGNYQTNALNIAMWPNTYLFSIDSQGNFASCCVLGFHTYIYDPTTTPQQRWVYQYASWISPGLFRGGFQDVTALSHETSEAFNDPFVDNAAPRWQFPNQPPTSHVCQANLETGDPVEVLATATVPITLKERHEVFVYHPQTEALLQWFEMGATSNAIDGAFSFPDEGALPQSALPCPP